MARLIDAMHSYHGKNVLHQCKDCQHLISGEWRGKHYHKCEAYGLSHSEATDWRLGYTACKLYDEPLPSGFVPVLERLKHSGRKRVDTPIDGQTEMFGGADDAKSDV